MLLLLVVQMHRFLTVRLFQVAEPAAPSTHERALQEKKAQLLAEQQELEARLARKQVSLKQAKRAAVERKMEDALSGLKASKGRFAA